MIRAAFIASLVLAQPVAAGMPLETCLSMAEMAENIMRQRQNGAPLREMIAIAASDEGPVADLAIAIVEDAYNQPQFSTPEFRDQAVSEFGVAIFGMCRSEGA